MPLLTSLLAFLLTVYCLLDVALSPPGEVRNMPRAFWVLVVLFVPLVGAVAWLFGGRPRGAGAMPGGPGRPGNTGAPPQQQPPSSDLGARSRGADRPPRGPEDDPEFVRRLEDRLRGRGDDPASGEH